MEADVSFGAGNYYRPLFLAFDARELLDFRGPRARMAPGRRGSCTCWSPGLTFVLVRKLTGQFTTAWLAALIFGVHPIHHEVVAWVSGTTESLFAILFLLAFLAYLQSRNGSKALWMAVSCALYALALLSKETAIVLPALVFAHGWIEYCAAENENAPGYAGGSGAHSVPRFCFFLSRFFICLVRYRILSGLGHSFGHVLPYVALDASVDPAFLRQELVFAVSSFRILRPVLPAATELCACAPARDHSACAGSGDLDFRGIGWARRQSACAVAWIVIPLLPALDTFVFRPDELVHDRYFYVPSIGAALLVALIIERVARHVGESCSGSPRMWF